MHTTDTLIIGAGQAGLAVSRCLTDLGRDHVVLERGRVAERWHSERWDSLRLLTPNWMTRLPGLALRGPDPDGFMTAAEVADVLRPLRRVVRRPGARATTSTSCATMSPGRRRRSSVTTDRRHVRRPQRRRRHRWCDRPAVPAVADGSRPSDPPGRAEPTTARPTTLPDGGVLVVGASATGVQLADELRRSRAPRHARRRPPQPVPRALPGHGHLLVARP